MKWFFFHRHETTTCKNKCPRDRRSNNRKGLKESGKQTTDQAHFLCKEEHFHDGLVVRTGGKCHDRVLSKAILHLLHTTQTLQLQRLLETGRVTVTIEHFPGVLLLNPPANPPTHQEGRANHLGSNSSADIPGLGLRFNSTDSTSAGPWMWPETVARRWIRQRH